MEILLKIQLLFIFQLKYPNFYSNPPLQHFIKNLYFLYYDYDNTAILHILKGHIPQSPKNHKELILFQYLLENNMLIINLIKPYKMISPLKYFIEQFPALVVGYGHLNLRILLTGFINLIHLI